MKRSSALLLAGVFLFCGCHMPWPLCNREPVADAGTDIEGVAAGDVVRLDGSASYDPDGDKLIYQWSLVSAPRDSGAELSFPRDVSPDFTPDLPGDYRFTLAVSDGKLSSSDNVLVSCYLNDGPVADAGRDQVITVSDSASLDGTGSYDADGDTLYYRWSITSSPGGAAPALSDMAVVDPVFTSQTAGLYEITLEVGDGRQWSDGDTVTVQVMEGGSLCSVNYGGEDLIITGNTTLYGRHHNIGHFEIAAGARLSVAAYEGGEVSWLAEGSLKIEAEDILCRQGSLISGDFRGYRGGNGGAGSRGANGAGSDVPASGAGQQGEGLAPGAGGAARPAALWGSQDPDYEFHHSWTGYTGHDGGHGGYNSPGGNTDVSIDAEVFMGSGGGGGSGGTGGGGAGRSFNHGGGGGGGGGGGNTGGGRVALIARENMVLRGEISLQGNTAAAGNGQPGRGAWEDDQRYTGGAGGAGGNRNAAGSSAGGSGGDGNDGNSDPRLPQYGDQKPDDSIRGARGGRGGSGAGGGLCLKAEGEEGIILDGIVDLRGGLGTTNGGSLKVLGKIVTDTAALYAGRVYRGTPE